MSALLGDPSAVGYQPTLARWAPGKDFIDQVGSITSVQAVYVPVTSDRPLTAAIFAHLDAVLSYQSIVEQGIYLQWIP